jgi:hypothetical protein
MVAYLEALVPSFVAYPSDDTKVIDPHSVLSRLVYGNHDIAKAKSVASGFISTTSKADDELPLRL